MVFFSNQKPETPKATSAYRNLSELVNLSGDESSLLVVIAEMIDWRRMCWRQECCPCSSSTTSEDREETREDPPPVTHSLSLSILLCHALCEPPLPELWNFRASIPQNVKMMKMMPTTSETTLSMVAGMGSFNLFMESAESATKQVGNWWCLHSHPQHRWRHKDLRRSRRTEEELMWIG